MAESWHAKKVNDVLSSLKTGENGLSAEEATARLATYGENKLKEGKQITPFEIFFNQFKNLMVLILILAAFVSALLGEVTDSVVIFAIVILNAVLGFVQEYKAERAMEALKKLAAPAAKVIRNGRPMTISSFALVPGDVIMLETGDSVPADCRILESVQMKIDESALTGESVPVKKLADVLQENVPLAERKNMGFAGTIITNGRGKAVVVTTGQNTELGKIATMVSETKQEETPLQKELDSIGRFLVITIGIIIFITFIVGIFKLPTWSERLLVPISLAVAAIPEGLEAAITIALAFGSVAMTKRNAITRKLSVVESLGSVNVICTDKTGTLTENQMTVEKIYVNNVLLDVSGTGYAPTGQITLAGRQYGTTDKTLGLLLKSAVLCNDARLLKNDHWELFGDPTEGCLLTLGGKANLQKESLEKEFPRVDEIPFDSSRKMMTTVHKNGNERIVFVKGALESVIGKCNRIMINGNIERMTAQHIGSIHEQQNKLADQAFRVLSFAYRPAAAKDREKTYESELIFLGMAAMEDPIRPEVADAVKICHDAGIRVVMITGDHMKTAVAIAKKLNIYSGRAMEGEELDRLSEKDLQTAVQTVNVYARASPETKMHIVTALQKDSQITAMTGDGVNDAPAIKKAEVGIAMGLRGTDVAKQSSDLVLRDDNFATIVAAIREGRRIYGNIRKFLLFLLGCNLGEVVAVSGGLMLLGNPILTPIQILWMNLVTDGAPALALSVQPEDKNVMLRKPRKANESVISQSMRRNMFVVGVYQGLLTLLTYYLGTSYLGLSVMESATLAFDMLVLLELFYALSVKSEIDSIFKIRKGEFGLYLVVIGSVLAQLAITYVPALQTLFGTSTVPFEHMDTVLLLSLTYVGYEEVRKFFLRRKLRETHGIGI